MLASGVIVAVAGCGGSVQTGTGGSGGGGGGSGGACSAFADEKSPGAVTLRFRNDTLQPIYLPSSCTALGYELTKIPDDGVSYSYGGFCVLTTCAFQQKSSPPVCGPCPQQTYRIDPGGTLETTWDATGLEPGFAMPAPCWAPGPHEPTCSRVVAAAAGEYRVGAVGFGACDGPCTCDADGVCDGSPSGPQVSPTPTTITLPSDFGTVVDVVFDTCAFGCPGGP